MNYSGIHKANLVVKNGEEVKVSGVLTGSILVESGGSLKISGNVTGNIILKEDSKTKISGILKGSISLEKNTTLKVSGYVYGNVIKLSPNVSLKVSGYVTEGIKEEFDKDDSIISQVVQEILEKNNQDIDETDIEVVSNMTIIGENNQVINNDDEFEDNNLKNNKYNFNNVNINGMNISSVNKNVIFVGNKQVIVKSKNKGLNITQVNGKSYVNGINLDDIKPSEDGIYYID